MREKLQTWGLFSLRLPDWGLLWVIFFSVMYQKLVPIGFLMMIIGTFRYPKPKAERNFKELLKGPALWLIAYFLWLLIAMLWTENQSYGWGKIENKLAFLLLPVLVFMADFKVTRKMLTRTFLASLFLSLTIFE